MTAINTPMTHPDSGKAFRQGVLAGLATSALLGATLTAAAIAAGVVQLPTVEAPAPAAPQVQAYEDFGIRHAPAAPQREAPMPNVQPAPLVQPGIQPEPGEFNQHNPLGKSSRSLY